jgi:hypothetical protein
MLVPTAAQFCSAVGTHIQTNRATGKCHPGKQSRFFYAISINSVSELIEHSDQPFEDSWAQLSAE